MLSFEAGSICILARLKSKHILVHISRCLKHKIHMGLIRKDEMYIIGSYPKFVLSEGRNLYTNG